MVWRLPLYPVLAAILLGLPLQASTMHVTNLHGNVSVRVAGGDRVQVRSSSPARAIQRGDASLREQGDSVVITVQPADGVQIDLDVVVPYGNGVEVETRSGAVHLNGLFSHVMVATQTGAVRIEAPWAATRLLLESAREPEDLILPEGYKFSRSSAGGGWTLADKLDAMHVTYGDIMVKANTPQRVELVDIPVPEDSPVKMHWQAPVWLDRVLNRPDMAAKPKVPHTVSAALGEKNNSLFRLDVRMVNLAVTVSDAAGHPVLGLKPEDFSVVEDGVPQQVSYAASEDTPFNLALLLDLSGSTQRDRDAMKEAARRFVGIARDQDRVALYALANDKFHVISRLSSDRERLLSIIDAIPKVSGASPLYDTVVLSYAEELYARPGERNAVIIISDGVDNQVHGIGTPSEVSFKKLRRAAEGFHAMLYPVLLDPFDKVPPPGWSRKARRQMEELAAATGGRLFPAHSLRDLDGVYAQVAEELRSVYSVAYSPGNQDFNGAWRNVQVRVRTAGAKVRTRTGYLAR
ncbi:MAG: VWA domain-containing protein [Acidobacteriia bacterium]|nr:VWA domain-containing protein [Terriglobia bacterium]